jgi:hypothetical protein
MFFFFQANLDPEMAAEIRDASVHAVGFASDILRTAAVLLYPPHLIACACLLLALNQQGLSSPCDFWNDDSILSVSPEVDNSHLHMITRPQSCSQSTLRGNI